jgi:hypothetical protein
MNHQSGTHRSLDPISVHRRTLMPVAAVCEANRSKPAGLDDASEELAGAGVFRNRPICHPPEVFVVRMLVFWLRRGCSGNTQENLVERGE